MPEDDFDSAESTGAPEDAAIGGAVLLKRKHDGPGDDASKSSKKRAAKRKKKNSRKDAGDGFDDIDEELSINRATSRMDASLTADFIARQTKRFDQDLSVVELEDKRIPETAFVDTSNWDDDRTLENLPSFLETQCAKTRIEMIKLPVAKKGSPHTLVATASGLRAADITRSLRVYQSKEGMVAKLFAKHIKLKDAIDSAKNTSMNIGVGTPQRLLDLVKDGALSLHAVTHIVIDGSHVNQKRRGILDMRETLTPLTELLSMGELRQRYETRELRIVVF